MFILISSLSQYARDCKHQNMLLLRFSIFVFLNCVQFFCMALLSHTKSCRLSLFMSFFSPEKEKVEGEDLQEWLKLVVAPAELTIFVKGKHENLLPSRMSAG